jgi:PHD/YefM family antitoxin component YafN of YafNO toxin-antitoxin module
MKISTAEFIKNYGSLADKALSEPVVITKNGRDRLVMLSVEEYARLKRRDRRVVRLEDFSDNELALIARAEVPAEYARLDDELKDWHP